MSFPVGSVLVGLHRSRANLWIAATVSRTFDAEIEDANKASKFLRSGVRGCLIRHMVPLE